jgi:hypothetical protein
LVARDEWVSWQADPADWVCARLGLLVFRSHAGLGPLAR